MMTPGRTPTDRPQKGFRAIPSGRIGWWALALSIIGLGSWVVLPIITLMFRETCPVTDTVVMPVIGMVLLDAAAVFNVLCVLRWKERSVLNVVALVLTIPTALFISLIVIGEGLAGV